MQSYKTLMLAVAFSIPMISLSHAQSFVEKAFVAKSRLIDKAWKKQDPNSTIEVDHGPWDAFLTKYMKTDGQGVNRVAYSRVSQADKKALQAYLAQLQAVDVSGLNRNEQYAFWINLYNASTVNIGLKAYPIKSILEVKSNVLDLKGPFNDKVATVNGRSLTLDNIESGITRPIWNDPRLHYAFNCAAVSCPNLGKKAYRGKTINAQLDKAARAYVNDTRGVKIEGKKITASKIYFWYSEDFGESDKNILAHIKQYANPNLKASLSDKTKISAYVYDWALNEAR